MWHAVSFAKSIIFVFYNYEISFIELMMKSTLIMKSIKLPYDIK